MQKNDWTKFDNATSKISYKKNGKWQRTHYGLSKCHDFITNADNTRRLKYEELKLLADLIGMFRKSGQSTLWIDYNFIQNRTGYKLNKANKKALFSLSDIFKIAYHHKCIIEGVYKLYGFVVELTDTGLDRYAHPEKYYTEVPHRRYRRSPTDSTTPTVLHRQYYTDSTTPVVGDVLYQQCGMSPTDSRVCPPPTVGDLSIYIKNKEDLSKTKEEGVEDTTLSLKGKESSISSTPPVHAQKTLPVRDMKHLPGIVWHTYKPKDEP